MTKNYIAYAVIALLGIGSIGYLVTADSSPEANSGIANNTDASSETNEASAETTTESLATNTTAGTYQAYDPALIAASEADTIVLFFHATWCPSCRALHNDITDNLAHIPSGVEIYRADFDMETDLRRQYSANLQHSVLTVTADGSATSDITHPRNLTDLLANL